MSLSPPIRRHSTTRSREEDLINAYEAEEERILNILSRKLEQLREDKVHLENVLEQESEAHVNRLTRELTALRLVQQQQQQQANNTNDPGGTTVNIRDIATSVPVQPPSPSVDAILETLRRENEQLRGRLADMERDYIRVSRLNEVYREELIDYRTRRGVPVDSLVGLHTAPETHAAPPRRSATYILPSAPSSISRPSSVIHAGPSTTANVPIPRPSSRIHRPPPPDEEVTSSSSPAASFSPELSPMTSTLAHRNGHPGTSYNSNMTALTTPNSDASLHATPPTPPTAAMMPMAATYNDNSGRRILSYPAVPPPSLSSSLGSPTMPTPPTMFDTGPISPVDLRGHVMDGPASRGRSASRARGHGSRERGGRVVETGSLLSRRAVPTAPPVTTG